MATVVSDAVAMGGAPASTSTVTVTGTTGVGVSVLAAGAFARTGSTSGCSRTPRTGVSTWVDGSGAVNTAFGGPVATASAITVNVSGGVGMFVCAGAIEGSGCGCMPTTVGPTLVKGSWTTNTFWESELSDVFHPMAMGLPVVSTEIMLSEGKQGNGQAPQERE